MLAVLSLVVSLAVAACPTCEADFHTAIGSAGEFSVGETCSGDWRGPRPAPECDCCESQGCADGGELPEGLPRRGQPGPLVAIGPIPVADPAPYTTGRHTQVLRSVDPPGRVRLHVQHASFLC